MSVALTGVIFTPGLEGNLFSVMLLADRGVRAEFDADQCRLMYDGAVSATADHASGLLLVSEKKHNADCVHVWHRRLGHRDPDG